MDHDKLTVQIMLGGMSTRMGTDKALVTLGGKTLLERAITRWQGYGAGVQLSVGSPERKELAPAGMAPITDIYPERGPLGGLHAGLHACPTDLMLMVAVDSPYLTQAHADRLLEAIGSADACIYRVNGRPQPLFGLYRRGCATPAETLILHGNNRMTELLGWVNTVFVDVEDAAPFRNLNTPEELSAAQEDFRSGL